MCVSYINLFWCKINEIEYKNENRNKEAHTD